MNNEEKRELCMALMGADSEVGVVSVLTSAGYWANRRVWRLYGDRENNFSAIGNQQGRPDAALGSLKNIVAVRNEDFLVLARLWRRSMPAAACDRAETAQNPKRPLIRFISKRPQYFLNRSSRKTG